MCNFCDARSNDAGAESHRATASGASIRCLTDAYLRPFPTHPIQYPIALLTFSPTLSSYKREEARSSDEPKRCTQRPCTMACLWRMQQYSIVADSEIYDRIWIDFKKVIPRLLLYTTDNAQGQPGAECRRGGVYTAQWTCQERGGRWAVMVTESSLLILIDQR